MYVSKEHFGLRIKACWRLFGNPGHAFQKEQVFIICYHLRCLSFWKLNLKNTEETCCFQRVGAQFFLKITTL